MLLIERYVIKAQILNSIPSNLWCGFSLLIINFNWVLFSHGTLHGGLSYCLGMLGIYYNNPVVSISDIRILREFGIYLLLAFIFSLPCSDKIRILATKHKIFKNLTTIAMPILYACIFLWALSFSLLGHHSPFMYQQF